MKIILAVVIATFCSLFPTLVWAELSYDRVGIEYQKQSTSGDPDISGFGLGISKGVSNNVFFGGDFMNASQSSGTASGDIKYNGYDIYAGFHAPIQANLDFLVTGGFEHSSAELAGYTADGSGYALSGGIRAEITPQVETMLLAHYSSTDVSAFGTTTTVSDTGVSLDLGFKVTPQVQIVAGIGSFNAKPENAASYSSTTMAIGLYYYY